MAGSGDAGERLDRFLARSMGETLSRMRLKALIETGRVTKSGATLREPSHRVKPGDSFEIAVPAPVAAEPEGQAIPLSILHEDADLIVIDKPAGLVVHPAPGNPDGTLVNALIAHCGDQLSGIGGVKRPGIVHRLDKDTSGVMVAAKSDAAHQGLAKLFAAHDIDRAYRAVVWGQPVLPKGEIRTNIGRDPKNRQRMAVLAHGGRPAATHYKVLKRFTVRRYVSNAAMVECVLESGRTHQIRVHMAHLGNPIMGDPVYARRRPDPPLEGFKRQALHAFRLGFRHPVTGEKLLFESALPADMVGLISALEQG